MILYLNRNLRKTILQGHPWVYKQALTPSVESSEACLAVLKDSKKKFLAWGMYDPYSPLAFRVLSLKDQKPKKEDFQKLLKSAFLKRLSILSSQTNALRLINGEGDLLPGLVCDLYSQVAVLQFDGQGPKEFWTESTRLKNLIEDLRFLGQSVLNLELKSIVVKERGKSELLNTIWGDEVQGDVEVLENNVKFKVKILEGQKTGFFLDQRDNRDYVRSLSKGKNVLNLFSYTGGFSIYAGLGGADQTTSVDISKGACEQATKNWGLNGLSSDKHTSCAVDVFEFLKERPLDSWDLIVVDPPSMTHSEKQKPQAMTKYIEVFSQAAKKLKPGGDLILSSCSSHIDFDDFFAIINESLSKARRRGQILKVSGQGGDHPFLHISHELRYLKFVHLVLC